MFRKSNLYWYRTEGKRLLTAGLLMLSVLFCSCAILNSLTSATSQVQAADSKKEKTEYEASRSIPEMKKKFVMEHTQRFAQYAQETGAPVEQALTEEQVHLQEIKAIEAAILPGQYPIMGESSIEVREMVDYFKANEENYPTDELGAGGAPDIETFCQIYYEEAVKEGVRPEVAFAQTMKETGWLQYGGDASISQYNFAGLGTTGGGVAGNSYADVRTGIRAQIQHLKAYATDQTLSQDCVDDRYTYVTKGCAPFVEWLGQNENPEGYGWATGLNYGYDIVDMIHEMRKY